MTKSVSDMLAGEIAAAVTTGTISARAVVEETLTRIGRLNTSLVAFTDVTAERARAKADGIDLRRRNGDRLGPLAGVPFSVKNLYDVKGVRTLAGSKINRDNDPAAEDATLVSKLEAADAILVGSLNMGEYAYDFTGENVHYGASRNPHDLRHMSGGSSGGSGTAVASGMTPLSLGSDTNGSIRVPASFCGLFGLKPTYGRLSRANTYPFVTSFDHLGPLARSARDLALAYDAMQGSDERDPMQVKRPLEPSVPSIEEGIGGLRIARAGGYFARGGEPLAFAAVNHVAQALEATHSVEIEHAAVARTAAYLITMAEGSALHLSKLQTRPMDYDPDVRDRLVAGTMIPAAWVVKAQKFRRFYRERFLQLFDKVDIILAPSTPCAATQIGQKTMVLDGVEMLVRANIGVYTQPISFIGLPVAAVPVWLQGQPLPIGVQVIGPPWREDLVLRVARYLERAGTCAAPVAKE
jgi:AtzE family amidohydrolase